MMMGTITKTGTIMMIRKKLLEENPSLKRLLKPSNINMTTAMTIHTTIVTMKVTLLSKIMKPEESNKIK